MTTRSFGSGIRRREDPRLITGRAPYTDDIKLPGMVHAAILRSPHAHANITSIDASGAASQPGVVAVYTGADTDGVHGRASVRVADSRFRPEDPRTPGHREGPRALRRRRGGGRGGGDALPGGGRAGAHRTSSTRRWAWSSTPGRRHADGAAQLHDDVPNNIAFTWVVAGGDADAAFAEAEVTVSDTITLPRLIANPMEPRVGHRDVHERDERADAVEHHAEPAHRAVPLLRRDRACRSTRYGSSRRKWAAASAARSPTTRTRPSRPSAP